MKKHVLWLAALALTVIVAAPAQAQWKFGGQASYGLDIEEIAIGGRAEFGLPNKLSQSGPLSMARFVGSLDYWLLDCGTADSCSLIEINPGLVVPIQAGSLNPYVGAGLNYIRSSAEFGGTSASDSDTGINLIGGLSFPLSGMAAYTEARLGLGDAGQLAISFGLLFGGSGSGN